MSAGTSDTSGRLLPPARGVALRLYRQGLGDSFLLAFPRTGPEATGPFYLLIDCGVILGTPDAERLMRTVVRDIAAATGGRIDLLVITHEHWDHVSGFLQAAEVWESAPVHIESVWMAWTEDLRIDLAKRLKEDFRNNLDALRLALDQGGREAQHASALTGLLGLFGDPHAFLAAARAGKSRFSEQTHEAMRKARSLAGDRVDYRHPGEALALPGVSGARVYVLGPPQDERVLRNINPSKRSPQTYTRSADAAHRRGGRTRTRPSEKTAFTAALRCRAAPDMLLRPLSDDEKETFQRCFPFDRRFKCAWKDAARDDFFLTYYGLADAAPAPPHPATPGPVGGPPPPASPDGPAWRRISREHVGLLPSAPKHGPGDTSGRKPAGKEQPARRKKGGDEARKARAKKPPAEPAPAPPPVPQPEPQAGGSIAPELLFPFDAFLRVRLEEAARLPFFREHFGFDGPAPPAPRPADLPASAHTVAPMGAEWRRIDTDWLGVASEMALQMDSYTNNTSLALAIELVGTGKVLLFPADAQVGNWLSWDLIEPKFRDANGNVVTAADLLRRTVFYKVGHHGSHNATMSEAGLERMTSRELVAFVPVDERVAHEVRNWRDMPFEPLLTRLYEKTEGRVIRLDQGVVTEERPQYLPEETWARIAPIAHSFREERVRASGRLPHPDGSDHPLYYQLVIDDLP